jgi:uncharacterized membrane protein YphA (DoxX/SURF4 family)
MLSERRFAAMQHGSLLNMCFQCLHKRWRPHNHRTNDLALLAVRLTVAALLLPAGIGKLLGLSGFTAMLASKGLPYPDLLAGLAVAAEILGPAH